MSDPSPIEDTRIEARSYFVRGRNALAVRADFGSLYMDYYLHLMQHSLRPALRLDGIFKEALAALTLHLVSRPWREVTAWTVNFQSPPFNLFVTGDNFQENVTGRVFTEDVKEGPTGLFYSQVTEAQRPVRQSVVEFTGDDFFKIVEHYYQQSEQRLARYFHLKGDEYVMISAQPQCDINWLKGLSDDDARVLDEVEPFSLLETRYFRFDCGCNEDRIFPVLANLSPESLDELYGADSAIQVSCPRCGAGFPITRHALDAFIESRQ